jgi:hypothetical protein
MPPLPGTENTTLYLSASTRRSGPKTESSYALPGKERKAATAPNTTIITPVQGVEPPLTEPRAVLELRKHNPTTPYRADNWDKILKAAGLLPWFAKVPKGICSGFILNFPTITVTQTPTNSQSVDKYKDKLNAII